MRLADCIRVTRQNAWREDDVDVSSQQIRVMTKRELDRKAGLHASLIARDADHTRVRRLGQHDLGAERVEVSAPEREHLEEEEVSRNRHADLAVSVPRL